MFPGRFGKLRSVTFWMLGMAVGVCTLTSQGSQSGPTFELAALKLSAAKGALNGNGFSSGQLSIRNTTMRRLIAGAWLVKDYTVIGGPAWLDSEQYDLTAQAPAGTLPENLSIMMQNLLIERVHLAIHRENKVIPVYALTVSSHGHKLKAAELSPVSSGCQRSSEGRQTIRTCRNLSMAAFAQMLPGISPHYIDAPILNLTGLDGFFDFTLRWTPEQAGRAGKGTAAPLDDAERVTIFDALESQLGLKLVAKKEPFSTVVVDRAERVPIDQ